MKRATGEPDEEETGFTIPTPVAVWGFLIVVNPLWAAFAGIGWVAHRRGRVPSATFAILSIPAAVVAAVFGGLNPARWVEFATAGLRAGGAAIGQPGEESRAATILSIFAGTAPLALFSALVCVSVASWWLWKRRPDWDDRELRPSLWQWRQRRRVIEDIALDRGGPKDGCTVGVDLDTGKRAWLTDAELAPPRVVVGAPGSGKTQTLLLSAREAARRGIAVVVIDLKGGSDVAEELASIAERYGRTFRHWSIHDPAKPYMGPADAPSHYDPVGRGDPSRRKDLLIASQQWDVEYYRQLIASYLQLLFRITEVQPNPITPDVRGGTLPLLASLLNPEVLRDHAHSIPGHVPHRDGLIAEAEAATRFGREERSALSGMYGRIQQLATSTAGPWLTGNPDPDRNIDLGSVIHSGDIVCFSLDTSTYNETARLVGGLIIQDLKTICAEARMQPTDLPTHIYIDEFAELDAHNIIGLINKSRDAKLAVTLATQALGDLRRADHGFADQVLGNAGTFMIHRANTYSDAEILAGLTGRKVSYRRSHSRDGQEVRVDEIDSFNVSADMIQSLPVGQCILVTKSPHHVVRRVQVVMDRGPRGPIEGPIRSPLSVESPSVPQDMRLAAADAPDFGVFAGVQGHGEGPGEGPGGFPITGDAGSDSMGVAYVEPTPTHVTPPPSQEEAGEFVLPVVDDIPTPTWGGVQEDDLTLPPPPPIASSPPPTPTPQGRPGITQGDLRLAIDGLLKGSSLTQVLHEHDRREPERRAETPRVDPT